MKSWFKNKNILITGVSSGIGFEMAKIFASEYSCNVFGVARSLEKLNTAKDNIDKEIVAKKSFGTFDFISLDVSNKESWDTLKNELKKKNFNVDLLINNAGIFGEFEKFENQDIEKIENILKTNIMSCVYGTKTFVKKIKDVKGGIVNISSSASLCPVVGTAVYGASKAAIKNFTETIRYELKNELYVGVVFPGFIKTELFREQKNTNSKIMKFAMNSNKMARKIVNGIKKKKARMKFGIDCHFMNFIYKLSPKSSINFFSSILRSSKEPMFDKVFNKPEK